MDNVVADALLCIETNARVYSQPHVLDFTAIAKTQATDSQILSLQSLPTSTLVVEGVSLPNSMDPLFCDTSTGTQNPLVPLPWRRTVFNSLHGLSHLGVCATQKLVTSRFVWPGINSDIHCWTHSCIQCQRAKIQRHTATHLSLFPTPDTRFDVIHIDIVGPLHLKDSPIFSHVMVDHFTHWQEAISLPDITAETVVQAFLSGWIAHFGVPSITVTDCG